MSAVRRLDNSSTAGVTDAAGIHYPGAGKMLLVFTLIGLLTSARARLSFGHPGPGPEGLVELIGCTVWFYPWAVLSPLVFRIERRFPLGSERWPRHLALLAATSIPISLLASPLMMGCFAIVRYALGRPSWPPAMAFWFGGLPTAETVFWCSVAGGYFLRTLFQLHEQERRASRLALEKSRLEATLNQAQLEALRAKLNPHFLFNSLQNISVLTRQDPQTASRMLTVLCDLLRAVLRRDSQPESTLREEIELTRSYVALEQMRFGDRLQVTFEVAAQAQQAMVPCFLMQPLIENAIIHGLRGVRKTGLIAVHAAVEQDRLVLTVSDNGIGPPPDSTGLKIGVGLGSTCERLDRMYSGHHQFSIRKPAEGGTEVRIAIPLRFTDVPSPSLHEEIPALNR